MTGPFSCNFGDDEDFPHHEAKEIDPNTQSNPLYRYLISNERRTIIVFSRFFH